MPIFCYRRPDGGIVEEFFHPTEKRPQFIRCADGVKAERDIGAEHRTGRPAHWGRWPKKSIAAGVHPSQIPEARKANPNFKFDPQTGEAIFDSPQHEKQCLREIGFVDLSAC